jgi:iron(III) transport system substrate-binding protein
LEERKYVKMKRIAALAVAIAMLLTVFGGCSSKNEEANNNGAKELKGTTIKVVAAYGGPEKIFAKFTEDTGINVEFLDMSSGEVLARVEAEGGKPMAEVWFGGGADSFMVAGEKGLLEAYVSPEEANVTEAYRGDDYWTGVSMVLVGFMYNKDVLAEKGIAPPKTWSDLIKPEYKDEVAMSDPSISGTNYAVVNSLLQTMGEEEGWKYLETLKNNIPYYSQRGGDPPQKVAVGEMAVGIIPMTGDYIGMAQKYPVESVYPEDGIPWVPAGLAIFKNADNLEGAKAFVDWALSKNGQEVIRDVDPRLMVRDDVAVPELMKDIKKDKLMDIDLSKFSSQRDTILEQWMQRMAK